MNLYDNVIDKNREDTGRHDPLSLTPALKAMKFDTLLPHLTQVNEVLKKLSIFGECEQVIVYSLV